MKSFINVTRSGPDILTHYYIEDGIAKTEKVKFKPILGIHATKNEQTKWKDIYNKPVKPLVFESMIAADKWKKENRDVLEILGNIQYPVQFIATQYRKDIVVQKQGLKVLNFDIEVYVAGNSGFPRPELAQHEINAITFQDMIKNEYFVFACKDYTPSEENIKYIKCKDEVHLLNSVIDFLHEFSPHILTGWNIDIFDIPYIINRTNRVLTKGASLRISPEGRIREHINTNAIGQKSTTYSFDGIVTWDYINLYKKYQLEPRESYSLDFISQYEMGEEKVKFKEEYGDLNSLYDNNFDKFIQYNIQDTTLVYNLNEKLGFIDLALTVMYKAKCVPDDIFGTISPWDCIFYNELLKQYKLCPEQKSSCKVEFVGGFVKEPVKGYHKWISVYDIVSSYPNQIRSFNISPETIINDNILPEELLEIRKKYGSIEKCIDVVSLNEIKPILQHYDVSFASNGQFFRNDIEGFIPKVYSELFNYRIKLKKDLKQYKELNDYENAFRADKQQHAIKILLNAGYGAMSNIHFRYFDIRMAEAVTSNGQVCVRGVSKHLENVVPFISNIYSDTDSVFISMEKLINERFKNKNASVSDTLSFLLKVDSNIIEPKLNEFFDIMKNNLNMRQLTIKMEAECIANTSIFTGKKRYILNKIWEEGTTYEKPKMKIRGIEIVRSSTPQWVRDKLKDTIVRIFNDSTNEELITFIESVNKEFRQLSFEEIAFNVSANFNTYTLESKGLPIQVRAALKYNEILDKMNLENKYQKIHDGNKIKYAYIKEPNIVQSDVIACYEKMPKDIASKIEADYNKQFQKTYMAAIKRIFEPIGWQTEKSNSLDDFFS